MRQNGFKVSHLTPVNMCSGQRISGKGNYYDNAVVETFFKTIILATLMRYTLLCSARLELSSNIHGKRGDRLRWLSSNT
jgi:transposase InsO family protein